MTAPLPLGLLSIVATTEIEPSSCDPSEICYLRACLLNSFWKRHQLFRKVYKDDVNYRCEHFFWRIWSNPRLSSLSDERLKELWFRLQSTTDLTPLPPTPTPRLCIATQNAEGDVNAELTKTSACYDTGRRSSSVSPTNVTQTHDEADDSNTPSEDASVETFNSRHRPSQSATSRPNSTRITSSKGKRASFATATKGTKSRPALPRKRSSQVNSSSTLTMAIRPILKTPQGSSVDTSRTNLDGAMVGATRAVVNASAAQASPTDRRISGFELGSPEEEASSWQSTDSNVVPDNVRPGSAQVPIPLHIEPDFRQVFQRQKSSSAIGSMIGGLHKTGSVVRFADDVHMSEDVKKLRDVDMRPYLRKSEGALPATQGSWRNNPQLEHRDSIGSVAAISDDDYDDDQGPQPNLPRVKSGLSLAVDALKRTRASHGSKAANETFPIITSPQIEEEQQALISGKKQRRQTEEEEKLLRMGHRDGVTKAGGINLPPNLTVTEKTKRQPSIELPEPTIF